MMLKNTEKKTTLVKDMVGQVRTSTRNLPSHGYAYGARIDQDVEGAGAVISRWDVAKPSVVKAPERNLVKTHVLAVDHGNITAKDVRLFAQAHPEIRFHPKEGSNFVDGVRKKDKIPFDGPYGLKTEQGMCPLSSLIEARFTDFSREDMDYPDVSALQKAIQVPALRETKASRGHNIRFKPPPKQESQAGLTHPIQAGSHVHQAVYKYLC